MRGSTGVRREIFHLPRTAMEDTLNTYHYRDTDCTGRSLATLLIAWVGAAMVASVLLRWKYMWIALAVLTLLFLIACGYAACNARRAHERIVCRSGARQVVRRRHSLENIQTVSRVIDSNYVAEPPTYQTFWVSDLPPAYSAVASTQPPGLIPNYHLNMGEEISTPTDGPRLSNPPPYSIAVQSDTSTSSISQTANRILEPNVQNFQVINQSVGQPWALQVQPARQLVRSQSYSTLPQRNEDKAPEDQQISQSSSSVLSTGTGYLSNIISCTFGRAQKRLNLDQNDHNQSATNEERPSQNIAENANSVRKNSNNNNDQQPVPVNEKSKVAQEKPATSD